MLGRVVGLGHWAEQEEIQGTLSAISTAHSCATGERGKPLHDLSLCAIMSEEEFQECLLDVVSLESKWFTEKPVCKYT